MPDTKIERLYYRLPVPLQNILFSLKGLALFRQRYNKHFYKQLQQLRESEWWTGEQIRRYQDRKLRQLIHHAYNTVPFYKEWFDSHGVKPEQIQTQDDLKKLPVLTKEIVRQNQDTMVSTMYKPSQLVEGLTSGTTGTPLRIRMTKSGLAFQWAIWWRHKARFGLNPKDKHLVFGARIAVPLSQDRPPFWRHDIFGHRTYLSVYHLTEKYMPAILDYLNSHDFDFYTGYPSAMNILADYMIRNNIRLLRRPKYVVTGADALLPTYERRIREAFGVTVTEQYGMAEFAGNMSKCEYGKFHLDFECCCLEEQPIEGAPKGTSSLLFTGWGNPAMPFIRYQVGDYGRRSEGPCRCGRESICFDSIDGRIEDYVRTPDGRMVIGMNQVFEYASGAKEIQIYQKCIEEIEVRIVPSESYGEKDEKALLRELRRRVGESLKIKFVIVDHIDRTPSGKFRAVVSAID